MPAISVQVSCQTKVELGKYRGKGANKQIALKSGNDWGQGRYGGGGQIRDKELLSTDPLSWIFRGSFVYLFVLGKSVILPVLKSANLVWFL